MKGYVNIGCTCFHFLTYPRAWSLFSVEHFFLWQNHLGTGARKFIVQINPNSGQCLLHCWHLSRIGSKAIIQFDTHFFSQFLWTKAPWNFPWNDTFHLLPCPLFFTLAQLTAFKIYASLINFRNFVLGTLSYKITFSQGERENAISTESFLGRDC